MTLLTDREIDAEQLRAEEALEDFEVQPSKKVKLVIEKVKRGADLPNKQASILTREISILTKINALNQHDAIQLDQELISLANQLLKLASTSQHKIVAEPDEPYRSPEELYAGEIQDQNDEIAAIFNDAK